MAGIEGNFIHCFKKDTLFKWVFFVKRSASSCRREQEMTLTENPFQPTDSDEENAAEPFHLLDKDSDEDIDIEI